jgi:hypothetical protein
MSEMAMFPISHGSLQQPPAGKMVERRRIDRRLLSDHGESRQYRRQHGELLHRRILRFEVDECNGDLTSTIGKSLRYWPITAWAQETSKRDYPGDGLTFPRA